MKIEGAISVKAAIEANKRKVEEVIIDSSNHNKNFNYIRKIAKERNISIKEVKSQDFINYNPGKTFGGILAEVSSRKEDAFDSGDVFYICGIEDPYNIGYILRNLYAFGVNNVILDKRDYDKLDSQILKSSAGAYDFINIKYSDFVENDINELKNKGYKVYGLTRTDNSKDIFDVEFSKPSLIIVGGEKRGINAKIMNSIDEYVYIPYGNNFRNSLNASNALACVATLLYKQRK